MLTYNIGTPFVKFNIKVLNRGANKHCICQRRKKNAGV